MDRIISNSSSSQTDLMKSAQCCPGNSQVEGPSIHIFDSDYPLASIRALEEDDLGKEVYNRILENAHKMNYQYQDRSGCNYGTHSQASHVINVYLSTKIKKESATHKRLQRLCKSVSRNMGNAWNGKPVLSLELVVGSFHALVTVTCRSTWPTPTSPMPPNCKGPKNNRQKCPRCCYWNPVDNITGFCITCQLYMRPSSEQSVQANQLKNESTWKKIGKEMNFTMIAQPQFLRDRRSDLPLLSQDVEADQIKSYLRVEVGSYPTVAVISRLLCKGNRYAEIIFSDENNNDNNDDKNDNNDETIEMNTLYNLLDAGCRLSSKPSSPLQIVCFITMPKKKKTSTQTKNKDNDNERDRVSSSSSSSRGGSSGNNSNNNDPCLFKISFRLFVIPSAIHHHQHYHNHSNHSLVDGLGLGLGQSLIQSSSASSSTSSPLQSPHLATATAVSGGSSATGTTGGGGVWSDECHVLCAFLSGHSMASNAQTLGDSPGKTLCPESSLLTSSSTHAESGGYCDLSTTLVSILEGICREALRLGYRPPGFAMQGNMRNKLKLNRNNDNSNITNAFSQSNTMSLIHNINSIGSSSRSSGINSMNRNVNNNNDADVMDVDSSDDNDGSDDDNGNDNFSIVNGDRDRRDNISINTSTSVYNNTPFNLSRTYFWNHHRRSLFFDNNNNNSSSNNNNNRLQNSHSSQHRMSLSLSLSLSSQRYHDLIQCNSLSAVMTDLENLGFDAPLSTSSTTSNTNSTIISSSTNSIVDVADVDGIKVSLRPYQQQTLNWAIQQERLVGGLRRLISAPIIGSNGRSTGVWFSPLTGEFSSTAPSDVRGGFICEEMGMGKTIITLALILSNPAPVISDNENGNVNVSVADEHWGVTNEISTTSSNMSSTVTNSISQQTSTTTAKQSTTKDVNRNTHSSSNTTTTANTAAGLIRSRATLVVCPVSLVGQWCSEVREKLTQPNFNVVGYHGQNRERDLTVLANCDIVVTTYETLASELRRSENGGKVSSSTSSTSISTMDILSSLSLRRLGGLFNINWHRIVLDESHKIKSRSLMNDAVSLLVSKRRWCVTGTPVNTKLSDFAGQFRFLGIPILNSPKYWNEIISKPSTRYYKDLQMNDIDPDLGFSSLMTLLRRVVMRHSKTMKYKNTGECLVLLPSKYEHICMITLSYEEQQKYIRLENILMKRYKNILRQGSHVLHRSTIQLLSMIKDLQMACSGGQLPALLSTLLTECNDCNNSAFGECCICLDLMDDPLITLCRHIFCADCIYGAIDPMTTDGRTRCPLCRRTVYGASLKPATLNDIKNTDEVITTSSATSVSQLTTPCDNDQYKESNNDDNDDDDDNEEDDDDDDDEYLPDNCTISESRGLHSSSTLSLKSSSTSTSTSSSTVMVSKLEWLVKKLKNIHKSDKDAKVLVFSQFNQTIRWLQETLPSQGFRLRSLSGQMSLQQRKKALDDFQRDPPTTVFLLSMRAGAVGVNLTQANHVIVMEPCLNTALEEQAISRVHRIGQVREVHIYRLACCNSVEERILWSQYTDRKKGTGTAAGTSSTSTSNMNPVSFQHAATTTTATSMNVNRMGDPNDNIEAMLLHLRMRGRGLSSGGPSLSSSFPSSSPSFSSHTSPLVGSLTSDRGVVMGKRQYDILFGMKMPTAADLLAVGLQPQPDNTPEDEENDIDDIDIDMGNREFDAVLMDEECDSVRNDKDTHSDTATGSTSTSSSVFNTPTQTISGRKRRLNEIMMSPITLTTAMTMTTPTTTMTDNSHQTYSRPRRKSAAEGLKRIQEIAMMERQNAIESESELDIEEKGEV